MDRPPSSYCKLCYLLNRVTGTCEKYAQQLQALTIGREIKWIKCPACVEAGEKKRGEVE